MLALDLAIVLGSSCAAYLLRHGAALIPAEIAFSTALAAVVATNVFRLAGCYKRLLAAPATTQVARGMEAWSIVFIGLLILAYLTKTSDEFSRVWVTVWFLGTTAGLAGVRIWAAARVRRWRRLGKLAQTVAVVDLDGRGSELSRRLLASSDGEMHLVGVFSPVGRGSNRSRIDDLVGLARLFRIDEVIVSTSAAAYEDIDGLMVKLGTIPTNVRLCPLVPSLAVAPREASLLFGHPVLTVCRRPLGDWARVAKRIEDLVLSGIGIVLVSPVLLAVAVLVKLDSPGPILFRQLRLGFNNNVITVYKFRSMTDQPASDGEVVQAKPGDMRVTRVGRIIRRTSLDELPQLFNVLRGDMSLVGPRPHALAHNDQYAALIDGYLGRHRVQPGMTGWAQVNGLRGETDTLDKMQRRVEHDLAYTDDWSLALDLKILAMTVVTTLFDRNAY